MARICRTYRAEDKTRSATAALPFPEEMPSFTERGAHEDPKGSRELDTAILGHIVQDVLDRLK